MLSFLCRDCDRPVSVPSHFSIRILEFWRFLGFFSKKTFLNIFLNTKSRNVRFIFDAFQEKMTKLEKKSYFGTFLENRFLVVFRKNWKFFGIMVPKFFFSPFSYQSGTEQLIYAKKIIKNYFRSIAWTLSYF
jgi:hypothetical protein